MKENKRSRKKGKGTYADGSAVHLGICFEPLEPRLLLSGSWGAGVDAPSHDSQTNIHGGFTQETVVISEITVGSGTDTQHQNPRQTAVHVDLLAQAPVLNAVNGADTVLEASSTSNEAAPATGNTPTNGPESDSDMQPDLMAAAGIRELVFINEDLTDYQQLIADLQGEDVNRVIEVVVLDADRDGIEQVNDILAYRADLAAVHFITHGTDGQINLGNTWLNNATLQKNIDSISAWGNALTESGDILFYGCNIADGVGQNLLKDIAQLTGADVAASDDLTGSARLGGDWELEYIAGDVETSVAYTDSTPESWVGLLGQITVTTTNDTLDGDANTNNLADLAANPGADGGISLREAVIAANNDPDADTIFLQPGTYTLSGGDLVITEDLSIRGANANTTAVDGDAADRVFTIDNNSTTTLVGITIMNGDQFNSGGVFVDNGSTLYLSDAIVKDNSSAMGGGVHVHGTAHLDRVLLVNNTANQGGAIHFHGADGGSLTNVTISGNTATAEGGGLWTDSSITITNVTIADNNAVTQGGGLLVGGGTVDIANSIVADNSAGGIGDDVFGTLASSGSNLFEDFFGGLGYHPSDFSVVDPLSGLSDNGGNLMTHAPTAALAIDGADPTLSSGIDQRGFLRDDGSPDIGAHEAGASASPATAGLWLSTDDVVVDGEQPGDDSWNPSDLIGIADPHLNLGPGTTSGTFATVFDANGFSIGWDLNAATYVNAPIQIGSANFQLLAGDLLLSPKYNGTIFTSNNAVALDTGFQASVTANNADLVVFRPDTAGNYTQGQFGMLLEDVAGGYWLQGITLIEQDITVGGYALQAGDFLYTRSNPSANNSIWLYETGTTGPGATPVARWDFLDGDDAGVGISAAIHGIELLENTTEVGGQVLDAGTLLVNVDVAEPVGSNGLDVDRFDVFALKVSTSSLVGSGQATAQMLFDGSQVSFDSNEEDLDALALAPTSVGQNPIANNDSYSTNQDNTLEIDSGSGLLANDTDPNLDTLSATLVTGPSNGTLTVNPIGVTNEINLSNHGGTDTQPEWSPDGSKVAFVSDRDGDDQIYVINADGSGLQQLTTNGAQDFDISWSKDGSQIAFASNRDGNIEIYTMNADGSNQNRVTFRAGSTDQRPEWSPDGTQFVFQSNRDGNWDIFTMNADGSNPVNLTPGVGDESGPSWSPDGTKIAYRSYVGGNYDIYVMDADGGNKLRLTTHADVDNTPHWSPDGTKIVFETNRDGDYELFAIDPDGSNLTRLTDTTTRESAIVWSPDGTRFAYESDRDGNMEIYVGEIVNDGAFSYTPNAGFYGVDSFTYIASDGSNDSGIATATITVNAAPNLAPTFTSFSAPVDFTDENTEVEITFADLEAEGDEDDSDGTVDAFVVKSLASGTLKIGASAATATAFAAGSNDTINAANNAYWTPAPGANGTLNAFAVVAEDNTGVESITPVTATVAVAANPVVNDQGLSVDENALSGTPVGAIAATAGDPAHNYSKLYWVDVDTDELRRIELDGTLNQPLADQSDGTAATGPRSVTVDDVNGHVYWTNNNSGAIWRANLDGSSAAPVLTGLASPMGIAVDPSDEKIYWFDAAANELWRADFDGLNAAALITTDISTPKALAIDATGGKVYWTNSGSSPGFGEIKRADLDGSNIETVTSGLDAPFSIALDTVRGKVYWAEPGLQEIHRADMAAGVVAETVVVGLGEPRAVAVDALRGKLYWADAGTDRIERANLDGSSVELVTGTGQWPTAIALGPPVQNLTYAIAGGNTNGAFALDPVTGELTVANSSELDFETTPAFNLTVTVTDAGGRSDNATITVDLNNLNDNAPMTSNATTSVAENAINTTVVYDVNDANTGNDTDIDTEALTYSITAGNTDSIFAINPATGVITVADNSSLDYETTPQYILTVQASDGTNSDTADITIDVTNVNDEQVLSTNTGTTVAEGSTGTTITNTMLATTDVDNTPAQLVYTLSGVPANGTLKLSGVALAVTDSFTQDDIDSGRVTYDHDGSETLSDSFAFSVDDGAGAAINSTFSITVTPVNDAPAAVDDSASTNEDTPVTVNVVSNDTDIEGDPLTVSAVTQGTNGAVTFAGGSVTYTPNANFNGSDSFTYTVSDGNGGTDSATVDVTVNPVNDAPVAVDDTASTNEDTPVTVNVVSNDTDVEGDPLTVSAVTQGTNAAVTFAGGSVTYTPNANFSGSDSFTYTVSDGNGGTDTATVDVTVTPVNDAPVAVGDTASTNEDTPVTVNVVSNDTDIEGDPLTVSAVTQGTNGAVTFTGGSVTYTPNANFSGSDSFTYTVSDGNGGTDTATVDVTVNPDNDAPVAVDDTASTNEDTPVTVNVVSNDTDVEGDTLTVSAVTQGTNGAVTFAGGSVTYTPNANFSGSDSFTYTVSDGNGGTDTATIDVTVTPVNDAPVAMDDTASTNEDTPVTVNVVSNDTDVEGDPLTVSAVTQGTNGAVTFAGGSVTYTPNANFSGSDSFTYTVSDGNGGTDTATVDVTVSPVNDPGTVTIDNLTPAQGDTLTANVTDADGAAGAITYQWFRDGVAIGGATGKTYFVIQADVGTVITVTADYTDDLSSVESLTSGPTAPVTNVNDPGVVAIDNLTPVQGDTLTASVSDADGAGGTISYQWYRDGVAITGATGVSYLTVTADEGAVITVTADYIDDQGSVENLTSAGTAAVAHVNVAPTASNLNTAETYTEDIPLNLADIVVTDIDSPTVTVTLTLSDPAAGSLSTGSSGAVSATFSGGVWTASGLVTDVNALLAGVVFTPSANYNGSFVIAVSVDDGVAAPITGVKIVSGTPVGDTPQVSSITTPASVQSDLIFIDRNAADGAEVTHFRIADITNGTLYLADGITPIHDGDYITVAQGQAGVRFTPDADTLGNGSFTVESSEDGVSVAHQSGAAISVITVIPPSTSPTVTIPSGSGDTAGPELDTAPEASEPDAEPEAVAPPVNRGPAEESVPQHRGLTSAPMPVLAQAVRYVSLMRATGVDLRDIAERLSDNMGPSQKAAAADPGPQRADLQAGVHNLISARAYLNMVNSLDAVKKEMADDNQLSRVYLGSAIVSSVGLSVGYVVWLIRGGLLLSSLLSSLPAWQILDPLPILARKKDDDRSEDDESLESILDRKPPEPKPKKEPADESPDAEEKKR